MKTINTIKRVKGLLLFFIISLFLSGATALPVDRELSFLLDFVPPHSVAGVWGAKALHAYQLVQQQYPFLLYGYDWLAFAHFVLAILFIGPYNDPVKNKWVIQFGLIACLLILPFAMFAGHLRGIPFWWRLIDCSFGVFGFAVLWPCYRYVIAAAQESEQPAFQTLSQNLFPTP
jgi:hypothetical protein